MMDMNDRKIRVLVAKPGLDGHDRGAKVIARALRDAGMEVIYTGLRQTPEMIAAAALQEDVDAVGVSILSGAHNTLCPRIVQLLHDQGMDDCLVLLGGIVPQDDIAKLKAQGVAEFPRDLLPGGVAEKIAEEIVDPGRTLPRVFLLGIAIATGLYLLLNAAFLHVLPFDQIAGSVLVAGDIAAKIFGPQGDLVITVLALLVVLATLNGNIFVTPRVIFGLAREGLGPRVFAEVNAGGTPSEAMLAVGIMALALAATGTFPQLLSIAIALVLMLDSVTIAALFPLRARHPDAPFRVPLYPGVPVLFIAVYLALLVGTALTQPGLVAIAFGVLVTAWGLSWIPVGKTGGKGR